MLTYFFANLREANLRGARSHRRERADYKPKMLPGTDLTGAKLPNHLMNLYDGLENVKGISESARNLFLVVLAAMPLLLADDCHHNRC